MAVESVHRSVRAEMKAVLASQSSRRLVGCERMVRGPAAIDRWAIVCPLRTLLDQPLMALLLVRPSVAQMELEDLAVATGAFDHLAGAYLFQILFALQTYPPELIPELY
jgi:hypothetical protein